MLQFSTSRSAYVHLKLAYAHSKLAYVYLKLAYVDLKLAYVYLLYLYIYKIALILPDTLYYNQRITAIASSLIVLLVSDKYIKRYDGLC